MSTYALYAHSRPFEQQPFGAILDLIPLAESVIKLSAVCMMCHKEAAFSKRLGSETEIEVIGGADKYVAVCRECYHADPSASVGRKPAAKGKSHSCRAGSDEGGEQKHSAVGGDDEEDKDGSNDSDTESSSSASSDDYVDATPTKKQVRMGKSRTERSRDRRDRRDRRGSSQSIETRCACWHAKSYELLSPPPSSSSLSSSSLTMTLTLLTIVLPRSHVV